MTTINSSTASAPPAAAATRAPRGAGLEHRAEPVPQANAAPTSKASGSERQTPSSPKAIEQAFHQTQAEQAERAVRTKETRQIELEAIRAKVEQAIEQLNEQIEMRQRELGFSIEGETDRVIVNVFNKTTGELVRQIPTEAVVRAANSLDDLKGVLVDEIL